MNLIGLSLVLAIGANLYSNAEAAGTTRCYNCYALGGCQGPPIIECPEADETFACISAKLPPAELSLFVQGCVLRDSAAIKQICDDIQKIEDGSCKICDTDLCNVL